VLSHKTIAYEARVKNDNVYLCSNVLTAARSYRGKVRESAVRFMVNSPGNEPSIIFNGAQCNFRKTNSRDLKRRARARHNDRLHA
jgi:hypothetical protein